MKERKCEECGEIIPFGASACPNCGCPVEEEQTAGNPTSEEQPQESPVGEKYEEGGAYVVHDSLNEGEPYSPFRKGSWWFRDPWPMNHYPAGELNRQHPFLGWLFGPWHLTPSGADKEEYAVINNIFYMLNLIFKVYAYSLFWTFFKIWRWIIALIVVLVLTAVIISANDEYDAAAFLGVIGGILWMDIVIAVVGTIAYFCGIGKALHRYWPRFHKAWRKVNKRYWNAMLNK